MKVGILMGSPNDRDKMQPAADTLSKFGIDLDELLRSIDYPGKFVDIADDEDRVEIFVE